MLAARAAKPILPMAPAEAHGDAALLPFWEALYPMDTSGIISISVGAFDPQEIETLDVV